MGVQCIAGLDIGGTNCRIGLVDRNKRLYDSQIINTSLLQENIIGNLLKLISDYIEERSGRFDILAVSIGFPSTIDKERRSLISTPNIYGLDNVPIVSVLEQGLNIPVFIDRDVNILLYHDLDYFKLPESALTLGFYIGTGLGNAIFYNGKILLGKHGAAGELGHIPMIGKQKNCTCGNTACVEAYASGRYLEELCQTTFCDTDIKDIYLRHSESKELMEQVEYMAVPIATEINIFDPDYIILGGGLLQMQGFPKARLEQCIIKHTRKPFPAKDLTILYSLSEQENGIIGAAIYGFKRMDQLSVFRGIMQMAAGKE